MCVSLSSVCVEKSPPRAHTRRLSPLKTAPWIMKYSLRRRPSDCQHGHLTNFTETHLKSERSGPPSEEQSGVIVVLLVSLFIVIIILF